jgi:beta-glucanase (GH16 family)
MSDPTLPKPAAPNSWLSGATAGATLTGVAGKDNQIAANARDMTLVGAGNGNNTFIVYDTSDTIKQAASAAPNLVETWGSGYILPSNVQDLSLEGGTNAYGIGNSGNNLITANSATDTLTTDGGNDVLVAGAGTDTFDVTPQSDSTTWVDGFRASGATHGILNLSKYFTSFSAVQAAMTNVGANLQINLGDGQKVMLANTHAAQVTASDVDTGVNLAAMHLTFDDEFNGPLSFGSSTVNTGSHVWNTTYSGGVRTEKSNAEQELYVDPSYDKLGLNPFSDSNGVLTIKAGKTPSADAAAVGMPYISGALTTQGSFAQEYGYFEAGIETPAGQGLWPAFWLLPAGGGWPPELDVMEQVDNVAGKPTTTYSTVHSAVTPTISDAVQMPQNLTGGFHVYGMNWTASTITFYVDGQQIAKMATPADAHQPMYMLLDLAVGGTWPGSPNASTDWSTAEMKVDYVRAYSTSATVPAAAVPADVPAATAAADPAPSGTLPTVVLGDAASPTDYASSFRPTGHAGGSTTYSAAQLGISGVSGTSVTVAYGTAGSVRITNDGAWNTIKNVTVKDSGAETVTLKNFVDTEVTLGNGASTVTVTGAKRGDITTGSGNSTISVTGGSTSTSSNVMHVTTGNGNNTVSFTGSADDHAAIKTGNGANGITLAGHALGSVTVGTGDNHITDKSSGAVTETLGSGSNVLEFLASAHATVSGYSAAHDSIVLSGVSSNQVTVTASGGSTTIGLGATGDIHLSGVSLTTAAAHISYA